MLLGELLGARVLDAAGEELGRVDDARLVRDGPYVEGFGNGLRVADLVVGDGGVAVRLGYVRHGVRGPVLVRWWARRRERRCLVVPWPEVAGTDGGVVRLRCARRALRPLEG